MKGKQVLVRKKKVMSLIVFSSAIILQSKIDTKVEKQSDALGFPKNFGSPNHPPFIDKEKEEKVDNVPDISSEPWKKNSPVVDEKKNNDLYEDNAHANAVPNSNDSENISEEGKKEPQVGKTFVDFEAIQKEWDSYRKPSIDDSAMQESEISSQEGPKNHEFASNNNLNDSSTENFSESSNAAEPNSESNAAGDEDLSKNNASDNDDVLKGNSFADEDALKNNNTDDEDVSESNNSGNNEVGSLKDTKEETNENRIGIIPQMEQNNVALTKTRAPESSANVAVQIQTSSVFTTSIISATSISKTLTSIIGSTVSFAPKVADNEAHSPKKDVKANSEEKNVPKANTITLNVKGSESKDFNQINIDPILEGPSKSNKGTEKKEMSSEKEMLSNIEPKKESSEKTSIPKDIFLYQPRSRRGIGNSAAEYNFGMRIALLFNLTKLHEPQLCARIDAETCDKIFDLTSRNKFDVAQILGLVSKGKLQKIEVGNLHAFSDVRDKVQKLVEGKQSAVVYLPEKVASHDYSSTKQFWNEAYGDARKKFPINCLYSKKPDELHIAIHIRLGDVLRYAQKKNERLMKLRYLDESFYIRVLNSTLIALGRNTPKINIHVFTDGQKKDLTNFFEAFPAANLYDRKKVGATDALYHIGAADIVIGAKSGFTQISRVASAGGGWNVFIVPKTLWPSYSGLNNIVVVSEESTDDHIVPAIDLLPALALMKTKYGVGNKGWFCGNRTREVVQRVLSGF